MYLKGEIFHAKNKKTDEDVAAKLETITSKDAKSQLRREAKIYYMLDGSGDFFKLYYIYSHM